MDCNIRNSLHIIIILVNICLCIIWSCTEGAQERESGEVYTHTVQVSSFFPSSSSCVLCTKASNTKSSLHVVHRQGVCTRLNGGNSASIDHTEILRHDQARVNSIHSKMSKRLKHQSQSTVLPAKSAIALGSGNYYVTVGIGTPKNELSLVFDTGSDLTWTQCEPCNGTCYPQKEPKFNPSSSSSYSNISCSSPECDSLAFQGLGCSGTNCVYRTVYGDESFTQGFLAKEKFTLKDSVVFDNVSFGCGYNNGGLFNGIAGLFGLGPGGFSFPSQTTKIYNNLFSYCIPSSPSTTGYLTFGAAGISNSVKYTPISSSTRSKGFYGIDIDGITVGDQKLAIPSTVFSTSGAIIDSGTVVTRLPAMAYAALRTAFKDSMSNYTIASSQPPLDTCYNFTGLETVEIPIVSFSFGGGTVVELDSSGILYQFDISQVCLAFAGNGNDDDVAIFGNIQQKTLQVVYDGPGGRIGFAPQSCT